LFRLMGVATNDVPPECRAKNDLQERLIQLGTITSVCYVCSGIVWIILFLLRRERFHTPCVNNCGARVITLLKEVLFWNILLAYSGLCALVTCMFLRDVSHEGAMRWVVFVGASFALDFLVFPLCGAGALKLGFDLTFQANRDQADRLLATVFRVSKEQAAEQGRLAGVLSVEDLLGGPTQQQWQTMISMEQNTMEDITLKERANQQNNENDLPPLIPLDRPHNAELQNAENATSMHVLTVDTRSFKDSIFLRTDQDNAIVDLMDLDNDGEIEHDEIMDAVDLVVDTLDDDGDGMVSNRELAEAVGAEKAAAMLQRYDMDDDGKSSKGELAEGYEFESGQTSNDTKALLLELMAITGKDHEEVRHLLRERFHAKDKADVRARLLRRQSQECRSGEQAIKDKTYDQADQAADSPRLEF